MRRSQIRRVRASEVSRAIVYQRHGFEVVREIQVGSSPLMVPMARVPK